MRLALFTDTFLPQTNGVSLTLQRLTTHLNRRGIEHLLFSPKSAPEDSYADPIRPITSIPFFYTRNVDSRYRICPPSSQS